MTRKELIKLLKIKKEFEIHHDKWNHNTEINQIRQDLDALEELGATHISFQRIDSSGYEIPITAFYNRFETDEEFKRRYRIDKYKAEMQEKEDLKLLEKLKLKYENK